MYLLIVFNIVTMWVLILNGLLTWDTPSFTQILVYGVMWAGSLLMLVVTRVLAGKDKEWLSWETDVGSKNAGFIIWLLGAVSVFFIAQIIPAIWMRTAGMTSALFVPKPLMLATGNVNFVVVGSDLLFNTSVVGMSEQMAVLASINAAVLVNPDSEALKVGAVAAAIGVWAAAHGYIAYVGPLLWAGIVMALVAGVVMFFIQKYTGSLLLTALVHSAANDAMILLPVIMTVFGMVH